MDSIDVRLPCRSFSVRYKIAEAGQHTLTSEFLLRILRVSGDLSEDVIADFFGFDAAEMRYAVDEAEGRSLVFRANGRVHLAAAGLAAFEKGGEKPHLYEVHQKRGRFDFDVVSFAPANTEQLVTFTREFCELPVLSDQNLARASDAARTAFRQHFRELHVDRRGAEPEGASLYTIDDVASDRRRDELVQLGIEVVAESPNRTAVNLEEWRAGHDLNGRGEVVASCAEFLKGLQVEAAWTAEESYNLLVAAAPQQASRFRRAGRFDRVAFFHHAVSRTGDVQSDRRTVPIVGSLWTGRNVQRLGSAIRLLKRERSASGPPIVFWLRPALRHWGSNRSLTDFVGGLMGDLEPGDDDGPGPRYSSLGAGVFADKTLHQRCRHLFDGFVSLTPIAVPSGLEIFLVPRRLAAILVHGPLDAKASFPVPTGLISVDPEVIERIHGITDELLARAAPSQAWEDVPSEVRESLHQSLEFAAPQQPPP